MLRDSTAPVHEMFALLLTFGNNPFIELNPSLE